jgi:hypothetical protein
MPALIPRSGHTVRIEWRLCGGIYPFANRDFEFKLPDLKRDVRRRTLVSNLRDTVGKP